MHDPWITVEQEWTCYASQDENQLIPSNEDGEGLHSVSDNFRVCSRFGFFSFAILTGWIKCLQNKKFHRHNRTNFLCMMVNVAMWLTFMLMVAIYRWRHAGRVCSGDYIEERSIVSDPGSYLDYRYPYIIDTGFYLQMSFYSQLFIVFVGMNTVCFVSGTTKERM